MFHLTTAVFSSACATFIKIDHMPDQKKKISVNTKGVNSHSMCFMTHKRIKLELNNRNAFGYIHIFGN